jgi:hypothetical protein
MNTNYIIYRLALLISLTYCGSDGYCKHVVAELIYERTDVSRNAVCELRLRSAVEHIC